MYMMYIFSHMSYKKNKRFYFVTTLFHNFDFSSDNSPHLFINGSRWEGGRDGKDFIGYSFII